MRRQAGGVMLASALAGAAATAAAQTQPPPVDPSLGITVTATRLDEARSAIQPSLGATTYDFIAAHHRQRAAGRERAPEPGAAARARRGAGQFRPDPCARRPRQRAVPARRRAASRGPVAVQQHPGDALRRPDVAADGRLAGAVRPAHRGHRRHHPEIGHDQPRRRSVDDRRLARLPAARLLLWRPHAARSTTSPPASSSTTASASRIRPRP